MLRCVLAIVQYGRLLLKHGDYDMAERELNIARDLNPARPEITYQLALLNYKRGNLQEAEQLVHPRLPFTPRNLLRFTMR